MPVFSEIPITYLLTNSYFFLVCGFLDSLLCRESSIFFVPHVFFVVNLHFVLHAI